LPGRSGNKRSAFLSTPNRLQSSRPVALSLAIASARCGAVLVRLSRTSASLSILVSVWADEP